MRIGILGGGQLARLLTIASYNLGFNVSLLCESLATATRHMCPAIEVTPYDDTQATRDFLTQCDVITFESENIPIELQRVLAQHEQVMPGLAALQTAQDRQLEKQCFNRLGITTNAFCCVDDFTQLQAAAEQLGYPFVLKQRSLGYDGRGQSLIKSEADVKAFRTQPCRHLMAESFVDFEREISVVGVRDRQGNTRFYPVGQNTHVHGILYKTEVNRADPTQQAAEAMLTKLFDHFNYTGVLALECFVQRGELLANEIAPRVHNSGHWTEHGALTSQFENHIRAISGLPLGATEALGHVAMFNVIGHQAKVNDILALDHTFYSDYQKSLRPGRKLGHINLVSHDESEFKHRSDALTQLVLANNV